VIDVMVAEILTTWTMFSIPWMGLRTKKERSRVGPSRRTTTYGSHDPLFSQGLMLPGVTSLVKYRKMGSGFMAAPSSLGILDLEQDTMAGKDGLTQKRPSCGSAADD
jgi:hypothetical protein